MKVEFNEPIYDSPHSEHKISSSTLRENDYERLRIASLDIKLMLVYAKVMQDDLVGIRVPSVPSLSGSVLVRPGQGAEFDVGPAPQSATNSTKRSQRQVTHRVPGASLVSTRHGVRTRYMVGVLTPEAH
jgi:hypothetical protein